MKKNKLPAIIEVQSNNCSGEVEVSYSFAKHLQVNDVLMLYGKDGELADWVKAIDFEGDFDLNEFEFVVRSRRFYAHSLVIMVEAL